MCSIHNRLGRDHYVLCALRPKSSELRAKVSKECCSTSPGRIHRGSTSYVSALTARFDPRWTVVVNASDEACVLRIGGISAASTTGNNVGIIQRNVSTRLSHG